MARSTPVTVISIDKQREAAASKLWDLAIELWEIARHSPSIDNMAKAVDARRAFERRFLGEVIT